MNSLQRDEELERLAKLISDESRYLRHSVRQGEYSHVESILGYLSTEIDEYFAKQLEAVR